MNEKERKKKTVFRFIDSFARSKFNLGDTREFVSRFEKRLTAFPSEVPFAERIKRMRDSQ